MPTAPAVLSAIPLRKLTSREIAQVLCGVLSGMATADPAEVASFQPMLEVVGPDLTADLIRRSSGDGVLLSWQTAFCATVAALYDWCYPLDIETALAWMRASLPTFCATGSWPFSRAL